MWCDFFLSTFLSTFYSSAAHIGVGISGQEGQQAVLASDFSFGQFRYYCMCMHTKPVTLYHHKENYSLVLPPPFSLLPPSSSFSSSLYLPPSSSPSPLPSSSSSSFLPPSLQVSGASATSTRTVVLPSNDLLPPILLLQKLCLHFQPISLRLLLWVHCTGKERVCLLHTKLI